MKKSHRERIKAGSFSKKCIGVFLRREAAHCDVEPCLLRASEDTGSLRVCGASLVHK